MVGHLCHPHFVNTWSTFDIGMIQTCCYWSNKGQGQPSSSVVTPSNIYHCWCSEGYSTPRGELQLSSSKFICFYFNNSIYFSSPSCLKMNNNSKAKITKLPSELALYLCKYLPNVDILNTLEAIPTWEWIASSKWLKALFSRRIAQWSWIDEYIYKSLFPQTSPHLYRDPISAVSHYENEIKFYGRNSHALAEHLPAETTIKVLVLPSPLISKADILKLCYMHSYTCISPKPQDTKFIIMRFDMDDMQSLRTSLGTSNGGVVGTNMRSTFEQYDCVLYLADWSRDFSEDLQFIADALLSTQTLAIAVVKSDMLCMTDILARLANLESSALVNTPGHWRLYAEEATLAEVLPWLREATLWRRIQTRSVLTQMTGMQADCSKTTDI